MKTGTHFMDPVRLSERVYRALLLLYPAEFRQTYSRQMVQVFRDVCRDRYRQGRTIALVTWWAAVLFDLLQTAIAEHRKESFVMSKTRLIQWSGWLLIFGGVFFVAASLSQLQPVSALSSGGMSRLAYYALVPGTVLVTLGLSGILLRYWSGLNLFGRVALLTVLTGAAVMAIGWLLTLIAGDRFWSLLMAGWLVQLAGQTVFGGFAVTTHLLPRGNAALLIGSVLPLTLVVLLVRNSSGTSEPNLAAFMLLLLIGIGWLLTGWMMNNPPAASAHPVSAQPLPHP